MWQVAPAARVLVLMAVGGQSLEASVNSRMSLGGTAPARVKEQLKLWRERLR